MLERQTKAFLVSICLHCALAIGLYLLLAHKHQQWSASSQTLKLSDFDNPRFVPPAKSSPHFQQSPRTTKTVLPRPVQSQKTVLPSHRSLTLPSVTTKTPLSLPVKVAPPQPTILPSAPLPPAPQVERKSSRFLDALNDAYAPSTPVKELYGEEFSKLSKDQKKFISDNLSGIQSVTQEYLYKTALRMIRSMKGVAIVEFELHPNGDITHLKIRQESGYSVLDDHALRTIENAYKDYPRPSVVTPIRIYVDYSILVQNR